jgi:two-component system sensor histidine kinase HydH
VTTGRFLVHKLLWPVVISSGVLLIVGIVGAGYVLQLQTAASDILAWNVTSIKAAVKLEIGIREIRSLLNGYRLTDDINELNTIPTIQTDCEIWLHESSRLARSPDEQVLMELIEQGYARFQTEFARLPQLRSTAMKRELCKHLTDDVLEKQILDLTQQYLLLNERELTTSSEHNQVLAERLALTLLLIGVCGAAIGLLVGYAWARGIIRTIVQISLPIHDVAGQLNEVVGPISVSDVTKPEDLDQIIRTVAVRVSAVIQRLRQSERDTMRAEQLAALGQLAAGLAHELRNPLMSMKILVQSALSDAPGFLEGPDLDVLDDEIVRLEKLVSTFLDFAGPTEPRMQRIELIEVLKKTMELVTRRARTARVAIHFDPPTDQIFIEADPAQLRQVILNLLLNALDANREGGDIWLELDLSLMQRERAPRVIVTVTDNGTGLPKHLRETMFDPFVSTKPTGIGLGLTICRRIILAHDGQISAQDRPDGTGGAVFRIQLPLSQPPSDQEL